MSILNFGSLNLDHTYEIAHFPQPGETYSARSYTQYCGGKGLNQSIALSKAGVKVYHAGAVGRDGACLVQKLVDNGVDVHYIKTGIIYLQDMRSFKWMLTDRIALCFLQEQIIQLQKDLFRKLWRILEQMIGLYSRARLMILMSLFDMRPTKR